MAYPTMQTIKTNYLAFLFQENNAAFHLPQKMMELKLHHTQVDRHVPINKKKKKKRTKMDSSRQTFVVLALSKFKHIKKGNLAQIMCQYQVHK